MNRIPTAVGNLGNRNLIRAIPNLKYVGEFAKFVQSCSESTEKCVGQENDQQNNSDILDRNGKVGNIVSGNIAFGNGWRFADI